MKVELEKNVTIDFSSILKNPEVLFDREVKWEKLEINEKVSDALKELFLAGCKIEVKTDLSKQKVIDFLEETDLIDFVNLSNL